MHAPSERVGGAPSACRSGIDRPECETGRNSRRTPLGRVPTTERSAGRDKDRAILAHGGGNANSPRRAGRENAIGQVARPEKARKKVNRNFSIITLDMLFPGLYNGPACKEKKGLPSRGGRSSRANRKHPAGRRRESAPNAERDLIASVGNRPVGNGLFPSAIRLASAFLFWAEPAARPIAFHACGAAEGFASSPPAPCRQDGVPTTTVGFPAEAGGEKNSSSRERRP